MLGWIVTAGGWLVGQALRLSGSGVVQAAIDTYNRGQDSAVRLAEINAETGAVLTQARTDRQRAKMNWPVFWVIICVMIGAPAFQLWWITLYNVFWHANGIWPQAWDIAAYPPSVEPWVRLSIEWLYDPIGAPGTVATALLAGKVAR